MTERLHTPEIRVVTGPPAGGVLHEAWARLRRPAVALFWRMRSAWLLHRGVSRARRWWNPPRTSALVVSAWLLALVLVLWGVAGLVSMIDASALPSRSLSPDSVCGNRGSSCGAVTGLVMPVLFLAASTALFLAWRLWRVRRHYTRVAKREPGQLVETAGSLIDEVVGRDQLCDAIMNNLRDRRIRRPHVIVGKVGSGKTALLVRLAEKLAAKGAVPVPVRLRDADRTLDFCELARRRFEQIVQPKVQSAAEQDRIWRWLRQRTDRIVVLADGLEEALSGEDVSGQRDNVIRKAIRKAEAEHLPLVVASRPHDPLRGMQSAITELEPLSEEAALACVDRTSSWRSDPMLLDRVVEVAGMTESPLYLQIARDLHAVDRLESLWTEGAGADPLCCDGWALRWDLMDVWLDSLVDGDVHPELPIHQDTRLAVVEYVSALACIGLASDRADVALDELADAIDGNGPEAPSGHDARPGPRHRHRPRWNELVAAALAERMAGLQRRVGPVTPVDGPAVGDATGGGPRMDVRQAATWGARMGLVYENGPRVRFQHSIMQAYLGSRFLDSVLPGPGRGDAAENGGTGHIARALRDGGRELLIAFTLHSRSLKGRCTCRPPGSAGGARCPVATVRDLLTAEAERLLAEARNRADRAGHLPGAPPPADGGAGGQAAADDERDSLGTKALSVYGTAVEIDSVDASTRQDELIASIGRGWEQMGLGEDKARLRETKLALVKQCGSAVRRVATADGNAAYRELFAVGRLEPDHRVRAAIAQEIGTGREPAFLALYQALSAPEPLSNGERPETPPEGADPDPAADPAGHEVVGAYSDREHRARDRTRIRGQARRERRRAEEEAAQEEKPWRQDTMRAWILPMLVGSVPMSRHLGSPSDDLERWVDCVTEEDSPPWNGNGGNGGGDPGGPGNGAEHPDARSQAGFRDGLALALAIGFKYAANRRPGPQSDRHAREFLIRQAGRLLKRSTFWYTRLTLLQALTLWALPDDVTEEQPIRGHGADPRGQVRDWLAGPGAGTEHPLVRQAGRLAVRALQTRRPERFLWIDETVVACQVGTEAGAPGEQRFHNLWIPPSAGWSTLDPAAQQLLADVLTLVVLGERGYRPKDRLRLLDQLGNEPRLPACLSSDRSRLEPVRAVEHTSQPGEKCRDDCRLKMCPYPAKAESLRVEFSEVFCMRQRELLRRWQPRSWLYLRLRRRAPWQRGVQVAGLRRYWEQMGARARDARPQDAANGGTRSRRNGRDRA